MLVNNNNLGIFPEQPQKQQSNLGKTVVLSVVAGLITKIITTYIWSKK